MEYIVFDRKAAFMNHTVGLSKTGKAAERKCAKCKNRRTVLKELQAA